MKLRKLFTTIGVSALMIAGWASPGEAAKRPVADVCQNVVYNSPKHLVRDCQRLAEQPGYTFRTQTATVTVPAGWRLVKECKLDNGNSGYDLRGCFRAWIR